VVGHAALDLDPRQPVPLARLANTPLVMPGRPNALRLQLEHALERKGIGFNVTVEADAMPVCLDLARRGVGLCPMPASALAGAPHPGDLRWAPLKGQHVTWALAQNESRGHSSAVQHGRTALLAVLVEIVRQGHWPGADLLTEVG